MIPDKTCTHMTDSRTLSASFPSGSPHHFSYLLPSQQHVTSAEFTFGPQNKYCNVTLNWLYSHICNQNKASRWLIVYTHNLAGSIQDWVCVYPRCDCTDPLPVTNEQHAVVYNSDLNSRIYHPTLCPNYLTIPPSVDKLLHISSGLNPLAAPQSGAFPLTPSPTHSKPVRVIDFVGQALQRVLGHICPALLRAMWPLWQIAPSPIKHSSAHQSPPSSQFSNVESFLR